MIVINLIWSIKSDLMLFHTIEMQTYFNIFCFILVLLMRFVETLHYKKQVFFFKKNFLAIKKKNNDNKKTIQHIFDHDPLAVAMISPDYILQDCNSAFEQLTGIEKTAWIGKKCYEAFGLTSQCRTCPVKKTLASGKIERNVKRKLRKKDREVHIEQTTVPLFDETGAMSTVFEMVVDTTEKVLLEQKNNRIFDQTIRAFIELIENRDAYTCSHSLQVKQIALAIGREMGLSREVLDQIAISAMLHDIGKIGIPEQILNKPGRLTDKEYKIIQQHPLIGYDTLMKIESFQEIAVYIRHHHEAWDGSGYPDHQKGEEIPHISRILAVADVYEALTSNRVYRKAMTSQEALAIMVKGDHKQFDPVVLKAFLALISKGKLGDKAKDRQIC